MYPPGAALAAYPGAAPGTLDGGYGVTGYCVPPYWFVGADEYPAPGMLTVGAVEAVPANDGAAGALLEAAVAAELLLDLKLSALGHQDEPAVLLLVVEQPATPKARQIISTQ